MKKLTLSLLGFAFIMSFSGAAVTQAATIAGKVAFEGTAPVAEKIKADADPKCKLMHPNGISSDEVLVNSNGTLKNVFIYVKEGLAGKTFETPKEPVKFDQIGCEYNPKVLGIQVNQPLEILNSDDTLHNVHSLATKSTQFNLGMPIKGMKLKKTFTKPEVMIKIKCEVHPWMRAYIGVVENPFYGVTGDDGSFELKNLPPGTYVVEAWHEKYGTQTQNVTVAADDQKQDISFQYKAS